mgnify:FL=1
MADPDAATEAMQKIDDLQALLNELEVRVRALRRLGIF